MNFKDIPIGPLIESRVKDLEIDTMRICNFFKFKEQDLEAIYRNEDITVQALLKWSRFLEYDFFRLYSQHLILYSPPGKMEGIKGDVVKKSSLPRFRKNLYTREIITFVLDLIAQGKKSKQQVIDDYRIPRSTLYKWIDKYRNLSEEDSANGVGFKQ